ncbi:LPS export ABC transporter periplasmic protein LptC [Jannaschia pohangensis]|uniref:Lipopolysaccharide export system protein LptC n=1 Tax=Jannaschia pohangensis TaxID=390807 RepID=A0A1I3TBY9_9RHOB|nr:LPS export ABC transporter periplasmic protein LptC [Jannaschia pohangensis]SFJ68475.1 lipopolysaccharide export system protein LptC [Jannaschia pohangensis]
MASARPLSESLHSRLVRMAKLVLPVLALMLLSTLFLLARSVNPDDAIPVADVDVSERARDQQLTMPRFTGVSQDGTAFDLSARLARPDPTDPRRMTAEELRLVLDGLNGGQSTVISNAGDVDTARRTLVLTGDVKIETSTGYSLTTDRLEGSLGRLDVVSPGPVSGDGPLGRLRAGEMRLNEDADGGTRLLFTGGVDLLYQPPT